ncbi:D-threonine aldolase [Baekduia alba]|uniref:alanine racemase n=1 Tax=Baekduia alba TaxID=2997333 RepID=UPI0023406B78|nr:alanine racemase [Baekduia alba]WCB95364.1 D-threonine aldolase [Baekduia alba]
MTAVGDLETPALVVDLDRVEHNIARVAAYAREHGLAVVPHAKTHKTEAIARRQLHDGAAGLTVAKSSEAEAFAARGLGPLLVHYPSVGDAKARRLAEVAGAVGLTVALDSLAAATPLAAAMARRGVEADVLVEVDVGLHRTGVPAGDALAVARAVDALPGLRLVGISGYPGHARDADGGPAAAFATADALLAQARDALLSAGLNSERVSGGSTSTALHAARSSLTEVRPGNYVFLDRGDGRGDVWGPHDIALTVVATVVSVAVSGRMVLDAGSKTLSEAAPPRGLTGAAEIVGAPEVEVVFVNEEHAVCDITCSERAWAVGDRVRLIPNHACTCVNLHDRLYAARGDEVVEELPLIARGAVR